MRPLGARMRHATRLVFNARTVTGLQVLRKCDFTDPIGPAARLDVEVREPVTRHTLKLMQLERWLQGAVTNPAEKVKKGAAKGTAAVKNSM